MLALLEVQFIIVGNQSGGAADARLRRPAARRRGAAARRLAALDATSCEVAVSACWTRDAVRLGALTVEMLLGVEPAQLSLLSLLKSAPTARSASWSRWRTRRSSGGWAAAWAASRRCSSRRSVGSTARGSTRGSASGAPHREARGRPAWRVPAPARRRWRRTCSSRYLPPRASSASSSPRARARMARQRARLHGLLHQVRRAVRRALWRERGLSARACAWHGTRSTRCRTSTSHSEG